MDGYIRKIISKPFSRWPSKYFCPYGNILSNISSTTTNDNNTEDIYQEHVEDIFIEKEKDLSNSTLIKLKWFSRLSSK